MQTLKVLTAAITFAALGMAGTAMAENNSAAGAAGGQTNETTQSTGQGSRSDTTGNVGSNSGSGSMNNSTTDTENADPQGARDTHTSPYKKTYPNEKPIGDEGQGETGQ